MTLRLFAAACALPQDLVEALRSIEGWELLLSAEDDAASDATLIYGADASALTAARARLRTGRLTAELIAIGADDESALAAFEAGAADYLVWPCSQLRLRAMLGATRRRIEQNRATHEEIARIQRLAETRLRIAKAQLDLDPLMQLVVDELRDLTGAEGAVVEMADGEDFVYRAASGDMAAHVGFRIKRATSLSERVLQSGEPLAIGDIESDEHVDRDTARALGVRSVVIAPLEHGAGAVGVLMITSGRTNAFDSLDFKVLQAMAEIIAGALKRQMDREVLEQALAQRTTALEAMAESQQQLRQLAITDPLTGLLNRRHFFELGTRAIDRALGSGKGAVILLIDADHFKTINDTYGHAAGDAALRALGGWLSASMRAQDIVARLGGEEFAALLVDVDGSAALAAAERIRKTAATTVIPFDGKWLQVTLSIGVAVIGASEDALEIALRQADEALYSAKSEGRDRVMLYGASPVASLA